MRTAIYEELTGDESLMLTLTGGRHGGGWVGEISRQTTPAAFDGNGEILACGLLKLETETPWGVHDDSARLYFGVLLYNRVGTSALDEARRRIYQLLHRQVIRPASADTCWEILHVGDTPDQEDGALGCGLAVSRFMA